MATIHTDWKSAIKGYKDYLALERGLSENSILAYMRDIKQFAKIIEKVDGARAHFSYITFNDKGEETLAFKNITDAIAKGQTFTLQGIKEKYKVSKKTEADLLKNFNIK